MTKKTKRKINKKKTKKSKNPFNLDSRLNLTQRKYCSCLMKVRPKTQKNAAYPICYNSIKNSYKKYNSTKRPFEKSINLKKLNCLFNYDFNKYNLKDIQSLAKEKDISIKYKKNNKYVYYNKNTLIKKIKNIYFKKKNI